MVSQHSVGEIVKLIVRPADLVADCAFLVDALRRYLTPLSDHRRFGWLYKDNPHGQAKVWVISDLDTHDLVGSAAAFPRRIYVNGCEALSWVLGDFWISSTYRSLGPALQLQRACLAPIDSGEGAFCYDFPSQSMMSVYKRLRIDPFNQMVRLAKPLRADRMVGKFIRNPRIKYVLSGVGNFTLRLCERNSRDGDIRASLHTGGCGEEFSQLARKVGSQQGVYTQRSAEYLNWRYLSHPADRYELLTARRQDRLLAYAVFRHHEDDATLVDLFGVDDPVVVKTLLRRLTVLLRGRRVRTVSVSILKSHPWISLLSDLGFRMRDACPVVVYQAEQANIFDGVNWFLMQGDRDS